MPPAVEPGEPPINIKTIIMTRPTPVTAAMSAVLKPAVRGVTAWNSERQRRCFSGYAAKSFSKKNRVGNRISHAVVTIITLLCILYLLKWIP